ncbi:hypothetical protein [Cellulomonas sp. P5_C5]
MSQEDFDQSGQSIVHYVKQAERAYRTGQLNIGWGLLHRAREVETLRLPRSELRAVSVALLAEIEAEKLHGWRRTAVRTLLEEMSEPPRTGSALKHPGASSPSDRRPPYPRSRVDDGRAGRKALRQDAALVREALAIRNGHFSNQYASLEITSHRRLWLLVIGILLLAWLLDVAPTDIRELDPVPGERPSAVLLERWLLGSMLLLGALGSVISAIQRLTTQPLTSGIPAQLGSFTATVTRPLIGAVAALTVYLAALGGLALPQQHPIPLALLAALTAGLTERLVVYREKDAKGDAPG